MLRKVISGGQTGVDRIGLDVAKDLGIETGGTAAKGWITEKGPNPSLREYGLVECDTPGYPPRTWKNVIDSDATVWFGGMSDSPGYYRTKADCKRAGKLFLENPLPEELVHFIMTNNVEVLNVAGNRGSKLLSVQADLIRSTLEMALKHFII